MGNVLSEASSLAGHITGTGSAVPTPTVATNASTSANSTAPGAVHSSGAANPLAVNGLAGVVMGVVGAAVLA